MHTKVAQDFWILGWTAPACPLPYTMLAAVHLDILLTYWTSAGNFASGKCTKYDVPGPIWLLKVEPDYTIVVRIMSCQMQNLSSNSVIKLALRHIPHCIPE